MVCRTSLRLTVCRQTDMSRAPLPFWSSCSLDCSRNEANFIKLELQWELSQRLVLLSHCQHSRCSSGVLIYTSTCHNFICFFLSFFFSKYSWLISITLVTLFPLKSIYLFPIFVHFNIFSFSFPTFNPCLLSFSLSVRLTQSFSVTACSCKCHHNATSPKTNKWNRSLQSHVDSTKNFIEVNSVSDSSKSL